MPEEHKQNNNVNNGDEKRFFPFTLNFKFRDRFTYEIKFADRFFPFSVF